MTKNNENTNNVEWTLNRTYKTLKNQKAYDRLRDRKNKRLYEYEEEEVTNDVEQEAQGVL